MYEADGQLSAILAYQLQLASQLNSKKCGLRNGRRGREISANAGINGWFRLVAQKCAKKLPPAKRASSEANGCVKA